MRVSRTQSVLFDAGGLAGILVPNWITDLVEIDALENDRKQRLGLEEPSGDLGSRSKTVIACGKIVIGGPPQRLQSLSTSLFPFYFRRQRGARLLANLRAAQRNVKVIHLVRDSLAVVEGWMRRSIPLELACFSYNYWITEWTSQAESEERTILFRYEDFLEDPLNVSDMAAAHVGVYSRPDFFLAKVKNKTSADGSHIRAVGTQGMDRMKLRADDLSSFVDPNVNKFQALRLEPSVRDFILKSTAKSRVKLGYTIE